MKHQLPFTRNNYLIENKVNILFEDILRMSEKEFERWVDKVRHEIIFAWDHLGLPPVGGTKTIQEITDEFAQLHRYPVEQFIKYDELSGQLDCIENFSSLGNGANQFFGNMFKTLMTQSIPEWIYRRKREEWEVVFYYTRYFKTKNSN